LGFPDRFLALGSLSIVNHKSFCSIDLFFTSMYRIITNKKALNNPNT
jgi:hypothetical protein